VMANTFYPKQSDDSTVVERLFSKSSPGIC
jgi:hypothetical protein